MRFLKYSTCMIIGLCLAGCTSLKLSSSPQTHYQKVTWSKRKQALSKLQNWKINGAFSIQQGDKTTIAAYTWEQQAKAYQIRIHSSLDLYSVIITGKGGNVSLWRSSNEQVTASSPKKLMEKELGWSLPLEHLTYWMRGLAGPGGQQSEFDDYGHLTYLKQDGWDIHFFRYLTVDDVDLPQMLVLDRGALHVKIVIKQWELN